MADLWLAAPALVGNLLKGKASFHSGQWAGQTEMPELKQANAKNNFICPLSQGPNYLSSTRED